MRWNVDDDRLPCTVLHTSVYARDDRANETVLGECSFTIGEIYIYQPLTTWLNLYENDAVSDGDTDVPHRCVISMCSLRADMHLSG
jgi:hypothetical protein